MSPETELPQPRFQTSTRFLANRIAVRDFHGGWATSLITFSTRIPSSPRAVLSTTVDTHKSSWRRIPCWWRCDVIPREVSGVWLAIPSGHRGVCHLCDRQECGHISDPWPEEWYLRLLLLLNRSQSNSWCSGIVSPQKIQGRLCSAR